MKFVALLSGGKDSCFNILHCIQNGHELIAAATLGPKPGQEELDSYMYQTVGQDAIHIIAEAMDVKLYRRVIVGDAVEQGAEYGGRDSATGVIGDETEDLYALLSQVKTHHPDIQGVSVGAILSNYQRVRVEHVCRRLSLTCLCYLWQRDQDELLSEMVAAGMESVLIKVAGIGLSEKHLGKTLAEMQPTLQKLNTMYGSHICGEGGEYETLTLDCPIFKYRVVLTEVEPVIHSDNSFATVAYLRVKSARLEPKLSFGSFQVPTPPLLDELFVDPLGVRSLASTHQPEAMAYPVAVTRSGSWVNVTNVQIQPSSSSDLSLDDEVVYCFELLKKKLAEHSLELSDCTNINILLSSMDLFAQVNAVYSTFFGTSPPSRACVASDLPSGIRLQLDVIAHDRCERQALHVQSLSYWAPANIGPYSQSITVDERIWISGQIGLIPQTLALPSPRSLKTETALACQNVDRILDVMRQNTGGGWTGCYQSSLYWLCRPEDLFPVQDLHKQYEETSRNRSPTLFVGVKALPKDAVVEKQVLVHTARIPVTDEDDGEVTMEDVAPMYRHDEKARDQWKVSIEESYFDGSNSSAIVISVKGVHETKCLETIRTFMQGRKPISVRVFFTGRLEASLTEVLGTDAAYVPCRFISTRTENDWNVAIHVVT